jgi:lipoprotein signal peptidase
MEDGAASPGAFGSMTTRKRVFVVLFSLLVCIAADQATKEFARSHLPRTKILSVAGGLLKFDYYENKGAVFSFE